MHDEIRRPRGTPAGFDAHLDAIPISASKEVGEARHCSGDRDGVTIPSDDPNRARVAVYFDRTFGVEWPSATDGLLCVHNGGECVRHKRGSCQGERERWCTSGHDEFLE